MSSPVPSTDDLAAQFETVAVMFRLKSVKVAQIAGLQAEVADLDAQITAMSSQITPIADGVSAYVAAIVPQ